VQIRPTGGGATLRLYSAAYVPDLHEARCRGNGTSNARLYSEEVARKHNLREFLLEQYKNFEQIPVRKVNGFDPKNLGYTLRIPIIGRHRAAHADKLLHSERPPTNPFPDPRATSARWCRSRTESAILQTAPPSRSSRRTACAASWRAARRRPAASTSG